MFIFEHIQHHVKSTIMKIFTRTAAIDKYLALCQGAGKSVGFVPTMGALHDGHLSLVSASKENNDITVCSLFVNPTQFNDAEDLEKYPRNHDIDLRMLMDAGCDIAFLPSVLEVYPPGLHTKVDVDLRGLDERLEGKFRPGHFDGMMEVVHRLLRIVHPERLYMGQKDYQQFLIVKHMISALDMPVELICCPILRETDGLAMSSRNRRLTDMYRKKAVEINRTLRKIAEQKGEGNLGDILAHGAAKLKLADLRPEYLKVCDAADLVTVDDWSADGRYVVLAAAWAGDIRLIDNMIF